MLKQISPIILLPSTYVTINLIIECEKKTPKIFICMNKGFKDRKNFLHQILFMLKKFGEVL